MRTHWIEINEHPRYLVSNTGRIWDRLRDRELGQTSDRAGYLRVKIAYGSDRWTVSVHRLVAGTFFDVDIEEYEVNHIDGDKTNNHISNLEICNRSENMKHAYSMGLVHVPKELAVRCIETGQEFRTMREAARAIGVSDHKSILRVVDKPQYSARGFHFESIPRR